MMFFDLEYSSWLQNLSNIYISGKYTDETSFNMVKVLMYQLLDILAHARGRGMTFEALAKILCSCYSSNYEACAWLLDIMTSTHGFWTESMLL